MTRIGGARRQRFSLKLFALLGALAILLAACGGRAPATPTPTPPPAPTAAPTPTTAPTLLPPVNLNPGDIDTRVTLRFVNGTTRQFDIQLEGSLVASSLAFAAPTPPIYLDPGTYRMRVVPARAGLRLDRVYLDQKITLAKAASTVLVLTGNPDQPTLSALDNDTSSLPTGVARLSATQLLPRADPITVSAGASTLLTIAEPGKLTRITAAIPISALTFAQNNGAQFTQQLAIDQENAYLLIVVGDVASARAALIADPVERETRLRVINASGGLKNPLQVDVYLDKRLVTDNLDPDRGADWVTVPARAYQLRVLRSQDPQDAKPVYTTQIQLAPNKTLDLVLFGAGDSWDHRVIEEDLSRTPAGYARFVFMNTVPGVNGVQLVRSGVLDQTVRPLAFGEASPPLLFEANPAEFSFRAPDIQGKVTAIEGKAPFQLTAGVVYLYLVIGSDVSQPALLYKTEVGEAAQPTAPPTADNQMRVRFVNGLLDGTRVSLTLNGKPLFADVEAAKSIPPISVPVQIGKLALVTADGKALAEGDFTQAPGRGLIIVAIGSTGTARILQSIEYAHGSNTVAVIQAVHAAIGVPRMRIEYNLSVAGTSGSSIDRPTATPAFGGPRPVELVPRLDYANVSPEATFAPGTYDFAFRDAQDNHVLATLKNVVIEAGTRYDILILPSATGVINPLVFSLPDQAN